jgi:tetratricopeptide (TPR) repeat protein
MDTVEPVGQLAKGASLGRYVVLGLVGRGGMGEVYAAYDPELDRKIAIKLLKSAGATPDAASQGRQRLLREAQAIARLSHPNVVVVHDVGTFEGAVFIAMEFVEGDTLGYWLNAATRDWREVREVFLAAGRGLAAAHAAGLVHRDFKPDNVMLTKSGEVRVMDFGLAREQRAPAPGATRPTAAVVQERAALLARSLDDDDDPDSTRNLAKDSRGAPKGNPSGDYLQMKLTETGAMMGTPAYMAPEQFAGDASDGRTDQFSFCVALWEALHGRRPFAGKNPVELMVSVVSGAVQKPPPDTRVPLWLRKVLLRGLSVDPAERYPSMAELLAALVRDPASRRRGGAVAAAMVLLVAVTGIGARRLGAGRRALCAGGAERAAAAWGPERRSAAQRAFTASGKPNAGQAFATAAALMDQYVERWNQVYTETCEATQVRGDQSAEVLDLRMDCLGERLSSARALADVLAGADAQVVDNAVAAASALPMLARCSDVAMLRAVVRPPEDPATRARVQAQREDVARVTALTASGQCRQAAAAGDNLLAAASAIGYQPLTAEALLAVSRLGENCGDLTKAVEQVEEASYAAEISHHEEVVIEAGVFASYYYAERLNDFPAARRWLRHAEVVLARFPGHPVLEAWLAQGRGTLLVRSGQIVPAIEEARRALALLEKARGPGHMDVGIGAQNLGLSLFENGQLAEADQETVRALGIMKKLFGDDSVRTAIVLLNYTEILTAEHRFDEARARIAETLAILRGQSADPYFVGVALLDEGRLALAAGDPEHARGILLEARRMVGAASPESTAEVDFALARAAWTSRAERHDAVRMAQKAREALAAAKASPRKIAEIDVWLAARG